MKNRIVILPYKMGSASARSLKDRIRQMGYNAIQVYPDRNYRPRDSDFIVNWGFSGLIRWGNARPDLNGRVAVEQAVNKLSAFKAMLVKGVSVPQFTENREVAKLWRTCYSRTVLNGCQGKGIVVTRRGVKPPQAPLYVHGIEAMAEYRVHVFNGNVIDYVKKLSDEEIKNHVSGAVFARNVSRIPRIEEQAVKAVNALGLNFGAVDIIMDREGLPYVLEVNTACGMEGSTIDLYANKLIDTAFGSEDNS